MRVHLMLDSGAFSAKYSGGEIKMDDYCGFIEENSERFPGGYIALDVINDGPGSYENWKEMRRRGLDPIPVYHTSTSGKWLEKYMAQTDRVAIGISSPNPMDTKRKFYGVTRVWRNHLYDDDNRPKVRVHCLGASSAKFLSMVPWDSVDASVVSKSSGNGRIIVSNRQMGLPGIGYVNVNVSSRRFHRVGATDSYFALPPSVKRKAKRYVESLGYKLPGLDPDVVKTIESQSCEHRLDLGLVPREKAKIVKNDDASNSVDVSYRARLEVNFNSMEEIANDCGFDFYHVAGVTSIAKMLYWAAVPTGRLKLLVSYHYLRRRSMRKYVFGLQDQTPEALAR